MNEASCPDLRGDDAPTLLQNPIGDAARTPLPGLGGLPLVFEFQCLWQNRLHTGNLGFMGCGDPQEHPPRTQRRPILFLLEILFALEILRIFRKCAPKKVAPKKGFSARCLLLPEISHFGHATVLVGGPRPSLILRRRSELAGTQTKPWGVFFFLRHFLAVSMSSGHCHCSQKASLDPYLHCGVRIVVEI